MLDDDGSYVRDCDAGEIGVISINGPSVFTGYKIPHHNEGLWLDFGDGKKWLNTGDLGRQDTDGYFYLTGRKKELIIRGGHNIDPLSIEEPLHRHPGVHLAAAIGRPDRHAGEVPVAYVQLKPGADVTEDELLAFAKLHITERAALPKYIHFLEEMPLTAVGKIFKPALKMMEIKRATLLELCLADVTIKNLLVRNDAMKGIVVELTLLDATQEDVAQEALGKFSFSFILTSPDVLSANTDGTSHDHTPYTKLDASAYFP
jgi:fatty-acyl-CoA synthase